MPTRLELDLAWLAGATPLMTDAYWRERAVRAAQDGLIGIGPGVSEDPVRQVGRWFERVHLYGLRCGDVEVLAANTPIRLGGQTLGELDVLVRHEGLVVHREIAVKFYLAVRAGRRPSAWIGPGRRDRLDFKLDHLVTHQLTLPGRARALGAWPEELPFPDRSEVLLLGALFSPPGELRVPEGGRTDAELGHWYEASDFSERFGAAAWCVLDKPWWLSPEHARDATPLEARAVAERLDGPRFVARVGQQIERAFVVPDGWFSGS